MADQQQPLNPQTSTKTLSEDCHEHVHAGWVSYLVSAPLHGRGSIAFWQSGVQNIDIYGIITRFICIFDLFWHVAMWLVLLVFEIWTYNTFQTYDQVLTDKVTDPTTPAAVGEPYKMASMSITWKDATGAAIAPTLSSDGSARMLLDELYIGAFGAFLIAFIGLVITIIFGALGQPAGKAWPSTVCFLFGGLKTSLVFSVLIILVAVMKWDGFVSATEVDTNGYQETVTMRQMLLWGVLLKGLLLAQLSANEKFWGSASDDDTYANFCFLLKNLKRDDIEHRTLRGPDKWGPPGYYASAKEGKWQGKTTV